MRLLANKKLPLVLLLALLSATAYIVRSRSVIPANSTISAISEARLTLDALPNIFLWAWERPERLDFIDTERIGVAYLAKTVRLHDDSINVRPRVQPLILTNETRVIAVVRIETARDGK